MDRVEAFGACRRHERTCGVAVSSLRLAVSDGVPLDLAPDPDAMRAILSGLPSVHLAAMPAEGGTPIGRYFTDTEKAIHFAIAMNRDNYNVYLTPNETVPDCGNKPAKAEIETLRFVFGDIDAPKDGTPLDKASVLQRVAGDGPTFVIDSGNGIQVFFRLAEPVDATPQNVAAAEAVMRGFVERYDGDPSVVNIDRLMRLPGTMNLPNARKRERGCVPCMARVLLPDAGQARPTLAQLQAFVPPKPIDPTGNAASGAADASTLEDLRNALAVLPADCSYPDWQRRGSAMKDFANRFPMLAGAARAAFVDWSNTSSKAKPGEPEAKWEELSADRTSYRVVFAEAARHGWKNLGYALADVAPHEMPFDPATLTANGTGWNPDAAQRYKLLGGVELKALAPLRWLIKGVLPARGLAVLYGPSGSGKSFLAIDLGCSIAEGDAWFGYRTKPASIVYLALEGEAGIRQRVLAWETKRGRDLPGRFAVLIDTFKLTNPNDIHALAAVCPAGGVVIVDTFARAGDDDPNEPKLRHANIEGALSLQKLIGGVVLLVAHTGKDETRGMSGQKTPFNAADAAISVTRKDTARSWKAEKVKDGKDEKEHTSALQTVFLGVDDDGDPITSCTVEVIAEAYAGPAHRVAAEATADELFLQLLADFMAQGRTVSPQRSSRTHAALQFAQTPQGKQFKRQGFEAAMERLFAANRIRVEHVGPASKRKEIVVAVVPEAASDPFRPPSDLLPSGSDPHADPVLTPLLTPSDPLPSDPPYPP